MPTFALRHTLDDARAKGMPFVEITTDPENLASPRVIAANGGVFVERSPARAIHSHGGFALQGLSLTWMVRHRTGSGA